MAQSGHSMMRNASGHPNHGAGTVNWFTIKATGVSFKACERSWSFDPEEGEATVLREASGLAAVVTANSPTSLRVAAENCNTFLISEHGYKRQFDRWDDDQTHLAYLWGEPAEGRVAIYGGCCFRLREYDRGKSHAMQWIWLHPYARRKGHLSSAWPYFRKRFGAFLVEPPYSNDMGAFLAKRQDHEAALETHGFPTLAERR